MKRERIKAEEVKPCLVFEDSCDSRRIYEAYIENIYFGNDQIKLRKHDKEYTNSYEIDGVSPGFNRIPSDDSLNQIPIFIHVDIKSNAIKKVCGLARIIERIHADEIRDALGTVSNYDIEEYSGRQAYAEDWELRKSILKYLEENHSKIFEIETIKEPRNFFRRLDAQSGIDDYNLTRLYTFDMPDGYAIVWEDIDLSLDKATYVFRATDSDHQLKINNIIEGISTLAQFKSTLSNQRDNQEELSIFRRKYGFVGSVRKNRGINLAFNKWRVRLEELANLPVPSYPSQEELEKLDNWKPYNPHKPNVGGFYPKPNTTPYIKIDNTGLSPDGTSKQLNQIQKKDIQNLLDNLIKFNSSFLEGINI